MKAAMIGVGLLTLAMASTAHAEGWYFMIPPPGENAGQQPLSAWTLFTPASPTAVACETLKTNLMETASLMYARTNQGAIALQVMKQAQRGQCVRASDPRLTRAAR
jgi:hypothetical protein